MTSLALAGCGSQSGLPEGDLIECAIGPGAQLSAVCIHSWNDVGGPGAFVITHPDGGFRRFVEGANGSLEAADGAVPLVAGAGDEVVVGDDRYVIPAEYRYRTTVP